MEATLYVTTDKAVRDLATHEQATSSCTTTNVLEQAQTFALKNDTAEVDLVEVQRGGVEGQRKKKRQRGYLKAMKNAVNDGQRGK